MRQEQRLKAKLMPTWKEPQNHKLGDKGAHRTTAGSTEVPTVPQARGQGRPQNHRLGGQWLGPSGEPEQRAQASPPPASHNPRQGRGCQPERHPSGPAPPLPLPLCRRLDPSQVPCDFPEAGNGENFFQYSMIPPLWRFNVFRSSPRTRV